MSSKNLRVSLVHSFSDAANAASSHVRLASFRLRSMSDLIFLSASQIADQIRTRKISPIEVVEAHLARIEKLNPKINAFVQLDAERALAHGRDAETAMMQGQSLGPLHGVPI